MPASESHNLSRVWQYAARAVFALALIEVAVAVLLQ